MDNNSAEQAQNRDSERLDWLEEHRADVNVSRLLCGETPPKVVFSVSAPDAIYHGFNLREAIDAAMDAKH